MVKKPNKINLTNKFGGTTLMNEENYYYSIQFNTI